MKLINVLSLLTIVLFNLLVLTIVYWLVKPYNPIDIKQPVKLDNTRVKSGGYLIYTVEYCKYTKITPTVTRYFVDGITYLIAENQIATKKELGCGKNTMQLYIPKALPKGEYKLQIIFRYQMNSLKKVDVSVFTETFIIE